MFYLCRVIDYLASGAHRQLPAHAQTELLDAYDGVARTLGRFAMAILGVAERRLEDELPKLYSYLRRLHEVANPLGVLPMDWWINHYRSKLVQCGLSYMDSEDLEIPLWLRPSATVAREA
jgi:hypothetical protein